MPESQLATATSSTTGRALASLANECEAYANAFYRRAKLWKALHYSMVTIGSAGPPIIGAVFIMVPGLSNAMGIASIITGAVTAICSFSGAKDLAKEQEDAGDAFKKIGLDIQFDGLAGGSVEARPSIGAYVERVKAQIDASEDPGLALKHFEWANDQLTVETVDDENSDTVSERSTDENHDLLVVNNNDSNMHIDRARQAVFFK
jgi:hypothetical protein